MGEQDSAPFLPKIITPLLLENLTSFLKEIGVKMNSEIWSTVKDDLEWQGKKPSGIAGVILYKASQQSSSKRTQNEVCKASGISEVTLRGLLKILNRIIEK